MFSLIYAQALHIHVYSTKKIVIMPDYAAFVTVADTEELQQQFIAETELALPLDVKGVTLQFNYHAESDLYLVMVNACWVLWSRGRWMDARPTGFLCFEDNTLRLWWTGFPRDIIGKSLPPTDVMSYLAKASIYVGGVVKEDAFIVTCMGKGTFANVQLDGYKQERLMHDWSPDDVQRFCKENWPLPTQCHNNM
jgi:hypothetical protein